MVAAAPPPFHERLEQLQRQPTSAAAVDLGLAAIELRREREALPLLNAISERARDPTLDHVIGLAYRSLGQLTEAIAAFDRAIARGGRTPRLLHARARAAMEAGLPSLDWFTRARAADPGGRDLLLSYAAALQADGRGTQADSLLVDQLRADPEWLQGHEALTHRRAAYGARDRSMAEIERAIGTRPRSMPLRMMQLSLLLQAKQFDEAADALRSAVAAIGANEALAGAEAVIETERGQLATAEAAFQRAGAFSTNPVALHWLRHLIRTGRPDQVYPAYQQHASLFGRDAWPYLSLAWRMLDDPRRHWLEPPALVQVMDLVTDPAELADLADALRPLHRSIEQPIDQSVRGGTQTEGHLFWKVDPSIQRLRAKAGSAVLAYIATLPERDPAHPTLGAIPSVPRFAGSWSVRLKEAGFHDPHVHPQGWLSSAFYVALPPPAPADPHAGWLSIGMPQVSLNTGLGPLRTIEPKPGRLILFPSTSWHGTQPSAPGERLTVAFDVH